MKLLIFQKKICYVYENIFFEKNNVAITVQLLV